MRGSAPTIFSVRALGMGEEAMSVRLTQEPATTRERDSHLLLDGRVLREEQIGIHLKVARRDAPGHTAYDLDTAG